MLNVDALEAINFGQLATATDRILFRSRYAARRRTATGPTAAPARGTCKHPTLDPYETTLVARPARTSAAREEKTLVIKPPAARGQFVAATIAIPALLGIAIGLTAML